MVVLYLTSSASGSGKTSIAAGIAKHLLERKRKVGYLKPIFGLVNSTVNNDAVLMQRYLGLSEKIEDLSPVFTDAARGIAGIKSSLVAASAKDVVIVEGPSSQGQLTNDLAAAIGARVIGVETPAGIKAAQAYYKGMKLSAIVLNKVPASRLKQAKADFSDTLNVARLFGIVPEDRALIALTVNELAGDIKGKIIINLDRGSELIENIMLAAMNPDRGPDYYSLRDKKAVVVKSDRPDMQLAALETPTTALIISGGIPPVPMVMKRAEARGVPVISTNDDVEAIIADIEVALRQTRLNEAKVTLAARLVEESLDIEAILK